MSDILIAVIVFRLVFGAAIFGMFLGRNLRVLEQKVNAIRNQKSEIFVYHPLLRIAHHVQVPVQNKDDQFRTSAVDSAASLNPKSEGAERKRVPFVD